MKNNRRQKTIHRSLAGRIAGALLALLLVAAAAGAAELPGLATKRLAEAAVRYEAAAWPSGPARTGLPLMAITADGYVGGPAELLPGAQVLRRFADDEGVERLLVELSVRHTAAEWSASIPRPIRTPRWRPSPPASTAWSSSSRHGPMPVRAPGSRSPRWPAAGGSASPARWCPCSCG